GGVPGDSFPDVSTGVLAQMQHLIAYSGERVGSPLAPRTREKQDEIVEQSLALGRPVRFDDLTNRWAADRNYAKSIEWVAERYRQANCLASGEPRDPTADDTIEARSRRVQVAALAGAWLPSAPHTLPTAAVPHPPACEVYTASYGGQVALLIRSLSGASVTYTVLQVDADLEQLQADAFVAAHAPNGRAIARFSSPAAAFARAVALCPGREVAGAMRTRRRGRTIAREAAAELTGEASLRVGSASRRPPARREVMVSTCLTEAALIPHLPPRRSLGIGRRYPCAKWRKSWQ